MEPFFTITPEEITLRSRTATTFTFKGYSSIPRVLSEKFILESKVGKDRYLKTIMETILKCDVVNPLLQFSSNEVSFVYVWEKNIDPQIHKSELTLTNASSITLSFLLKTEVPFNLSTFEQTLTPGQSVDLLVEFDPLYRDDRQSHVIEKALTINYRGHPQKDTIKLIGEVVFPNLKFDLSTINFGCILNDTSKIIKLKATNSCKIDVKYEWIYLEQTATTTKKSKNHPPVFTTPPSHVFDILPVNAVIHAGESEDIEFTMLSTSNAKLNSTVVCVVEGGPEYRFPIAGESSNVAYEVDKSILDFGKILFTDKGDQELTIFNRGKVIFNFNIESTMKEDGKYLEFFPSNGKVTANGSTKIIVRMRPGLPSLIKANCTLYVGHFDPVIIPCYCSGFFPSAVISLPRYRKIGPLGETGENVNSAVWESFQTSVISSLIAPDPALLPPAVPPTPAAGTTVNPPSYSAPDTSSLPFPPMIPYDVMEGKEGEDGDGGENASNTSNQQLSIASTTKGLAPVAIDSEMQRYSLCSLMENKLKIIEEKLENGESLPTVTVDTTTTESNRRSYTPAATTTEDDASASSTLLQSKISKYIDLKEMIIARYICDFGNVIIGQTKKKLFKITNASVSRQLGWTFDKKNGFVASGFSIEPEKVQKLEEGGSVDFMTKFFARSSQKIGPKSFILPMEIGNGGPGSPTIHIILQANVCLPEVELTTYDIDFGKILSGRSSKVFVGIKNISPVTAVWNLKKVNG
jgi:hypothetical protein